MLRQFILEPDEDKRLQVEGRYLVVTQATGPIELTIGGTTPVTVDEKDRIHMRGDSPNSRALRIKNVSGGVNTIELHTSDLLIDKRSGVDVKNSIAIADDQRIGIDPSANIVQAVVQNPIQLDANGNTVKIDSQENTIKIDPNENTVKSEIQNAVALDVNNNTIKIDSDVNTVKAEVQNPISFDGGQNSVKIEGDQLIGIDPNANEVIATINGPVQLQDNLVVSVDASIKAPRRFQALTTVTIADSNVHAVEQQHVREQLFLTASDENAGPIWLADTPQKGLPIKPGEKIVINTEQRVVFVGTSGDSVYVAEVYFNG